MVGRFNVVIEHNDGILDVLDPVHIVSIRRIDPKAAAAATAAQMPPTISVTITNVPTVVTNTANTNAAAR